MNAGILKYKTSSTSTSLVQHCGVEKEHSKSLPQMVLAVSLAFLQNDGAVGAGQSAEFRLQDDTLVLYMIRQKENRLPCKHAADGGAGGVAVPSPHAATACVAQEGLQMARVSALNELVVSAAQVLREMIKQGVDQQFFEYY